jgi:hypothetical protein
MMSGGHFDHNEFYLDSLADQLEQDIKYNEIPWYKPILDGGEELYGFQLEQKSIDFLKDVVLQIRRLKTILHEYDLAVSSDTCEKTFQESVNIK